MAFPAAIGHNNLPNGNFSPVIFSKQAQLAFRKTSVVNDITTNTYFGEIANFGDSVRIIKEPDIEVRPYVRGKQIVSQDLVDEDFTLVIDQAREWQFALEDVEKAHSHVDWMKLATDRAGYKMRDAFDMDVLGYIAGYKQSNFSLPADTPRVAADIPGTKAVASAGDDELLTSNKLNKASFLAGGGDNSIPVAPRMPGAASLPTTVVSPLTLFSRMNRVLDLQNVPADGRWVVVDPYFTELLVDEDSNIIGQEYAEKGALVNGLLPKRIRGFRVYVTNNLPRVGTGAGTVGATDQNTNFGVLVAGTNAAVASAENISKTETFRSQDTWADVVRGLHVYARKIIKPEGIVTAKWNVA